MSSTAYDFSFKSIKGEKMIDLSDFKGKVIIVVNTASHCGFTYQYKGLQTLHNSNEDLVVIGVPSNDFDQEPAGNEEIRTFCDTKFRVSGRMTMRLIFSQSMGTVMNCYSLVR